MSGAASGETDRQEIKIEKLKKSFSTSDVAAPFRYFFAVRESGPDVWTGGFTIGREKYDACLADSVWAANLLPVTAIGIS